MKVAKLMLLTGMAALLLGGCHGHGGGGDTGVTKVVGVVSKGIFTSGTVNVYALSGGKRSTLLKQAPISPFGTYSANIGGYVGPVVAEANGFYEDEATGQTLQVAGDAPIRAAVPVAQGVTNLPVTALTEIAVQKTGGSMTAEAIGDANKVVSDLFKVDIIATQPVPPNATALNSATTDQVTYTLALATISQLSTNASASLATTLANVATNIDVATSSMKSDTADQLHAALSDFTVNRHNETGITDVASTALANVGKRTVMVTVSVPGESTIGGVQGTITFPSGVTLNAGSPALTAKAKGALLQTNTASSSLSIGILSSQGFAAGDVLTFSCSVPSDRAIPAASDFSLSEVKILSQTGTVLPVTLGLTAVALTSTSNSAAGSTFTVTLSTPNGLSLLGGIQASVKLPDGVTLNPGSPTLTGAAVGALLDTNPTANSFTYGIVSSTGFTSGPFLTFTCTKSSGGALPSASAFVLSGVEVIGTSGAPLPLEVTVTVN